VVVVVVEPSGLVLVVDVDVNLEPSGLVVVVDVVLEPSG